MPHKFFKHTADIGIKAEGFTREELLKELFVAFTTYMYDAELVKEVEEKRIQIEAKNMVDGVVELLNKVLYLFDGEDFLSKELVVERLKPLEVVIRGELYNPDKHHLKKMVKAVTHHKACFKKVKDLYRGRIILDI